MLQHFEKFPSGIAFGCRRFAIVVWCSYGSQCNCVCTVHMNKMYKIPFCPIHLLSFTSHSTHTRTRTCSAQLHFDWLCCDCHSDFMVCRSRLNKQLQNRILRNLYHPFFFFFFFLSLFHYLTPTSIPPPSLSYQSLCYNIKLR